jgi:Fe-S-cluster containining protein
MARLGDGPGAAERARRAAERVCGPCSLCCTVLRVDELRKPAGRDCPQQLHGGGCAIHAVRPGVCRGYDCLWRQGGLEDDERPDRTGGVVDLEAVGVGVRLAIRVARRDDFDRSPALQAIAERHRDQMPVRITDVEDPSDPDRPFRDLLPDGVVHEVRGERIEISRDGELLEQRRLPWAERWARRIAIAWRRRRLRRHFDRI